MILVTGATGPFGNGVVNSLLKTTSASHIAVLVRDPAKAANLKASGVEIRLGDYDHYDSLVKAFKGIDQLLFVSASDIAKRALQQDNVVKAAIQARVRHIVYTSIQRKNETASSPLDFINRTHIGTEKALKASGISYTILKNNIYADMLPVFVGEKVLETGVIFLPVGEGKTAFAVRADMAEGAAKILTGKGHENKEYVLTGSEALSFREIAAIISDISGKDIQYDSPAPDVFRAELTKAGVPDPYISLFAGFGEGIRQGELEDIDPTLEKLLGRKPVSVREYLQTVYAPVGILA